MSCCGVAVRRSIAEIELTASLGGYRHQKHVDSEEGDASRRMHDAQGGEFARSRSESSCLISALASTRSTQNRDVMEVVFLFLDWLSTFAHITIKDGNQMDLTSMAKGEPSLLYLSSLVFVDRRS